MSPNILNLDADFDKREYSSDAVRRLFPTIEHYRSEGKALSSIYKALIKREEISMSFSSFRNTYYAQRKAKATMDGAGTVSSAVELYSFFHQ